MLIFIETRCLLKHYCLDETTGSLKAAGTTEQPTDNGQLAQHVGLGGRVVGVGDSRSNEFARSGLLLGASRLVVGLALHVRFLVVLLVASLDLGGTGGRLLLLDFVVLVVAVLDTKTLHNLSVGLNHWLIASKLASMTSTNLEVFKCSVQAQASTVTLGWQGKSADCQDQEDGNESEVETGHLGL